MAATQVPQDSECARRHFCNGGMKYADGGRCCRPRSGRRPASTLADYGSALKQTTMTSKCDSQETPLLPLGDKKTIPE